jgi:nucleoside-diphosphate-sugar epimerase
MTTWALTGASGFVGRALTAAALARGIAVRGLTRGTALPAGAGVVRGDLADREALTHLVRGADVVVHLAAYVHRQAATEEQRRECRAINVDGTAALVDAVAAAEPRPFLIFMSTANVYAPSDQPLDESSPCAPVTAYGETKLAAERIVLEAVRRGAIRACILRPAMIFGPSAPGNLARLVRMVKGRIVIELGGGKQRKTLAPVQNVVSACFAVEERNGEIYNVGGGTMSMREITAAIARAVGVRPLRLPLPRAVPLSAANAVDALFGTSFMRLVRTYASSAIVRDDKLRALRAYEPVPDVEAALEAAVRP